MSKQKSSCRVGAVQYQVRAISNWQEFAARVEYFIDVASDYGCDFLLFPELFTLELLSAESKRLDGKSAIEKLSSYTKPLQDLFSAKSKAKKMTLILGSHPSRSRDAAVVKNTAYIFTPEGKVFSQDKIHATPSERKAWGISGGNQVKTFDSAFGKYGVMICYDSEFPELARALIDDGVRFIFVPFCTDERQGYLRVRYSCHARAIENQCYMILAGTVGNLTGVYNMDLQYGQSAVLTPCDTPFAREGIAVEAPAGVETMIFTDLDLAAIDKARAQGTVQNLKDRRTDLYQVKWKS